MWLTPQRLSERAERLFELADEYGRPHPRLALLVGVHVDDDLSAARAQAAGHLRGQYGLELDAVERWTALGSIERVLGYLQTHVEVGVREFVLMPLATDPLRQYERLAEVAARLRARSSAAD